MKLNLIEFSSTMFTYNAEDKILVAEASDMGNSHLQKLSDDSLDFGFSVKSSSTGNVIVYAMYEVMRDDEDDVTGWKYRATMESQRKFPSCIGTSAIIFND